MSLLSVLPPCPELCPQVLQGPHLTCPRVCERAACIFNPFLDDLKSSAGLSVLQSWGLIGDQIQCVFGHLNNLQPHAKTDRIQDVAEPTRTSQFSKMHSESKLPESKWWRNYRITGQGRILTITLTHFLPFRGREEEIRPRPRQDKVTLPWKSFGEGDPAFFLAFNSYWNCSFVTPGSSKPVLEETSPHHHLNPCVYSLYASLSQGALCAGWLHETSSLTIPTPSSVSVGRCTELSASVPETPHLLDEAAAPGRPSGPASCLL